ncbi:MAG: PAS domain S-box protein [Anaerolineaceae bacterium]|nr:PAS domain S-box protein [Anaerolineaceae bacterium]
MKKFWTKIEWRITITYAIFGALWIFYSDNLVARLFSDDLIELEVQHYKGWFFVLISALLIFFILRNALNKQHLAQKRGEEVQEKFKWMIDASMDAVLLTNPDGSIQFANPAACQMFGWTEEEIIQGGRDLIVDTEDPRLAEMLEERAKFGASRSQLTYKRKNGEKFEGEVTSALFTESDGVTHTSLIIRDISEHNRALAEVEASRKRLSQIFASITDAFIVLDRDFRIVYANAEAARINQKEPEAFIGKTHWEEWPETKSTQVEKYYRQAMETQKTVHLENHYVVPGKIDLWLDIHAYPFEDGLAIYYRDITDKKHLDELYRQTSEMMNRVFDRMSDAFILLDNEWKIVNINPKALDRNHLVKEEVLGKSHWEVWPMTVGNEVEFNYRKAIAENTPVHFDYHYFAEGEYDEWHEIHAYPGTEGLAIYYHDITDRKRSEEALRNSEEKFVTLFNNSSVPMALASYPVRELLEVNKAWIEFLGYSSEEIYGKTLTELGINRSESQENNISNQIRQNRSLNNFEAQIITKSGKTKTVIASANIVPIAGLDHLLISMQDISSRKAMEEQLRALNETLENRVQERTRELKSRNEELETFTYSVSHDLKAPLRGIDGYSRLLQETHKKQLDQEGLLFLTNIRLATEQMNRLIEDLLQYSRLERRVLTSGTIDLSQLLSNLLKEKEVEINQQRIEVETDLKCGTITTDNDGLVFALRNLLDNAIKFTAEVESPRIIIRSQEENGKCILSVEDNGIGFEMKYSEKIFEIFQRLHRVEDYPGTGIGLAIVRKVMSRIGGRTWAKSELGKGSIFYLEIPL